MRYSSKKAVEYELKLHYELLDRYTKLVNSLSMYDGYVLKTTKIKNNKRYYSAKGPGTKGYTYIGGEETEELQLIREHSFYTKAIEVIRSNIAIMEEFIRIYKSTNAENINELLGKAYTLSAGSPLLRDEPEIERWIKENLQKKSEYPIFDPASLTVTAFDGTLMRSRAEALHYEAFYIYNVPAIFELPYEIEGEVYRPDFTILDVFLLRSKMWEHLGNWFHINEFKRNSYRKDTLHRIDEYAKIGFFPEFNLLLSFGTEDNVFDVQALHRKVAMFAAPAPSVETIDLLKRL